MCFVAERLSDLNSVGGGSLATNEQPLREPSREGVVLGDGGD